MPSVTLSHHHLLHPSLPPVCPLVSPALPGDDSEWDVPSRSWGGEWTLLWFLCSPCKYVTKVSECLDLVSGWTSFRSNNLKQASSSCGLHLHNIQEEYWIILQLSNSKNSWCERLFWGLQASLLGWGLGSDWGGFLLFLLSHSVGDLL